MSNDLSERLREAADARDREIENTHDSQDHVFGRNLYREALEELSRLKAGEGWQPTHKHYKGGLYREIGRGTSGQEWFETEVLVSYREAGGSVRLTPEAQGPHDRLVATVIVTDPLEDGEPFVLYQHSSGNHYVRPARLFDEPTRFAPLPPAPGGRSDG